MGTGIRVSASEIIRTTVADWEESNARNGNLFFRKEQIVVQPCEPLGPLLPNEVRGRTIATLVSPGTELAWASGEDFPVRPGYSAVFEVQERGAEVTGAAVGDLLFCMGSHRTCQQVELRSGLEWAYPLVLRGFKWEELLEGYNNSAQSIMTGFRKAMKWLVDERIPLAGLVHVESPKHLRRFTARCWRAVSRSLLSCSTGAACMEFCEGNAGGTVQL